VWIIHRKSFNYDPANGGSPDDLNAFVSIDHNEVRVPVVETRIEQRNQNDLVTVDINGVGCSSLPSIAWPARER
jgi:hypothetical protein